MEWVHTSITILFNYALRSKINDQNMFYHLASASACSVLLIHQRWVLWTPHVVLHKFQNFLLYITPHLIIKFFLSMSSFSFTMINMPPMRWAYSKHNWYSISIISNPNNNNISAKFKSMRHGGQHKRGKW